ncbi:hypothetical protein AMATHDRAFT_4823 [Amanita thiersii Skay4041]|uniref:F-box domain-containing protein n=1 Tax=Amanita thiersii Skay4041 TaxID=703135 RepID=A0A2A9NP71_9AGAR|nr:hypothetical protein AMATHDRAFT_4823 [Amanita thiersii Skay4041]
MDVDCSRPIRDLFFLTKIPLTKEIISLHSSYLHAKYVQILNDAQQYIPKDNLLLLLDYLQHSQNIQAIDILFSIQFLECHTHPIFHKLKKLVINELPLEYAIPILANTPNLEDVRFNSITNPSSISPHHIHAEQPCVLPHLKSLAICTYSFHYVHLLKLFSLPALERLVLAKATQQNHDIASRTSFSTFLHSPRHRMDRLRVLCLGDYDGDVLNVCALLEVLGLTHPDGTPGYFPSLKHLALPRLRLDLPMDGFISDILRVASHRGRGHHNHHHHPNALHSLQLHIECRELSICNSAFHEILFPCHECPEITFWDNNVHRFNQFLHPPPLYTLELKVNDKLVHYSRKYCPPVIPSTGAGTGATGFEAGCGNHGEVSSQQEDDLWVYDWEKVNKTDAEDSDDDDDDYDYDYEGEFDWCEPDWSCARAL